MTADRPTENGTHMATVLNSIVFFGTFAHDVEENHTALFPHNGYIYSLTNSSCGHVDDSESPIRSSEYTRLKEVISILDDTC